MKLSEAILLGSIKTGQTFYKLFIDDKTCAMGAAYTAIGITNSRKIRTQRQAHAVFQQQGWSWIDDNIQIGQCPVCGCIESTNLYILTHLNDYHKWTRPQIAAWVATIEPQDALTVELVGTTESTCDVVSR